MRIGNSIHFAFIMAFKSLIRNGRESKITIQGIKTHAYMDFNSSLCHDIMIHLYFHSQSHTYSSVSNRPLMQYHSEA